MNWMELSDETLGELKKHKDAILKICKDFGIIRLWLVGSRSRHEERNGPPGEGTDEEGNSDWDWLVQFVEHTPRIHEETCKALMALPLHSHIITLLHVVSQYLVEDRYDLYRDAVMLVRNGQWLVPKDERLIPLERYEEVFGPWSGKTAGYMKANGNCGDWMIDMATEQLCQHFGVKLINLSIGEPVYNLDVIFSAGAGNFGRYEDDIKKRTWALTTGVPVVVLPNTRGGPLEDGKTFHQVWLRDHVSKTDYSPSRGLFAPDLALALSYRKLGEPVEEQGIFMRKGWEATKAVLVNDRGDPIAGCATVEDYMKTASRFSKIVTNRLHFAIAGLIQGRDVTLRANNYHKNRSVWESSLAVLGCKWQG